MIHEVSLGLAPPGVTHVKFRNGCSRSNPVCTDECQLEGQVGYQGLTIAVRKTTKLNLDTKYTVQSASKHILLKFSSFSIISFFDSKVFQVWRSDSDEQSTAVTFLCD